MMHRQPISVRRDQLPGCGGGMVGGSVLNDDDGLAGLGQNAGQKRTVARGGQPLRAALDEQAPAEVRPSDGGYSVQICNRSAIARDPDKVSGASTYRRTIGT